MASRCENCDGVGIRNAPQSSCEALALHTRCVPGGRPITAVAQRAQSLRDRPSEIFGNLYAVGSWTDWYSDRAG